jgi:phenylpropionate dioxygenase-like ring-hydroxylating dioxygenase large terminal subunit
LFVVTTTISNTHRSLLRGWQPLCRVSEVSSSPTAFRLLGQQWVTWLTPGGDVKVFDDRCPHRLAPLSLGVCEGEGVRCGYHGWLYDVDGRCVEIPALGQDAAIPARARLRSPAAVVLDHGMVFVAVEEPLTSAPILRAASDPTFQVGDLPVLRTRGSAALLADNFLDVAHFPFVHVATFGADEAREVPNYSVERSEFGFSATYEHEFANREDPGVATGERPLIQRRRLTYRYSAPFHLELEIEFLDAGGVNVIGFFLTPEDEETVRIYSSLWRNDLGGSTDRMQEAIDFEVAVIDEDLRIQSRYERLEMPLDVTVELHTRADRTTLEFRRILGEFVEKAEAEAGRAGEI